MNKKIIPLPYRIINKIFNLLNTLLSWSQLQQIKSEMGKYGDNIDIELPISTLGLSCFTIGNNFNVRKDFKLRAYQEYEKFQFLPEIAIGNNFYAGTQSCIAIIGKLVIGDNVTLASRVTIIDHAHGKADYSDMEIPVMKRELSTKGPIVIEDNVWICEGAVILGGVTIGKNSIVAANAVVTKDVLPYSIAAGVPAKIIKNIHH